MFIKTADLHGRQIIRSPRFADGSRWTSSATGREAIVVGREGDAQDPKRAEALYAVEYYDGNPNSKDYPDLDRESLGGRNSFWLARRLDPDGWCRPENEVLCVPYHGRHGIYHVDLVGYGPTEWLPDGISGQECIDRERRAWRAAAIWRDPNRMVAIASLQYGWVVRSEQFARAKRRLGERSERILTMYMDQEEVLDEARGKALYVVSSIVPRESEWDDGHDDYSGLDLRLCRLHDDGTYDACGEIIELSQNAHRGHGLRNYPFEPVEFMGLMSFDRLSGVIAGPPRPLTF